MHITELRIRHFRNFMKARFCFQKGVNTLIGENGSGKTNALHALRLLLDETLERNAIYLREPDFCRDLGQWRAQWIVVSADFSELDPSEGCQLLRHNAAHMDGTNTGTCTFFFRPKGEVRKNLHELSEQGEGLLEYLESITVDDYEPVVTGRARGDFLDDHVYGQWAGDVSAGVFPNPEDDDQDILGVRIPPIYQEVACTFVRALRDVIAELRGYPVTKRPSAVPQISTGDVSGKGEPAHALTEGSRNQWQCKEVLMAPILLAIPSLANCSLSRMLGGPSE